MPSALELNNIYKKHKNVLTLPPGFARASTAEKVKKFNSLSRSKTAGMSVFVADYKALMAKSRATGPSKTGGKGGRGGAGISGKQGGRRPPTKKVVKPTIVLTPLGIGMGVIAPTPYVQRPIPVSFIKLHQAFPPNSIIKKVDFRTPQEYGNLAEGEPDDISGYDFWAGGEIIPVVVAPDPDSGSGDDEASEESEEESEEEEEEEEEQPEPPVVVKRARVLKTPEPSSSEEDEPETTSEEDEEEEEEETDEEEEERNREVREKMKKRQEEEDLKERERRARWEVEEKKRLEKKKQETREVEESEEEDSEEEEEEEEESDDESEEETEEEKERFKKLREGLIAAKEKKMSAKQKKEKEEKEKKRLADVAKRRASRIEREKQQKLYEETRERERPAREAREKRAADRQRQWDKFVATPEGRDLEKRQFYEKRTDHGPKRKGIEYVAQGRRVTSWGEEPKLDSETLNRYRQDVKWTEFFADPENAPKTDEDFYAMVPKKMRARFKKSLNPMTEMFIKMFNDREGTLQKRNKVDGKRKTRAEYITAKSELMIYLYFGNEGFKKYWDDLDKKY